MSEAIDRVAAALYADWVAEDFGEEYCSWEQLPDKKTWRRRARAAIEALYEPTEAMCNAMDDVGFDNSHTSTLVRTWQAGIAAASRRR